MSGHGEPKLNEQEAPLKRCTRFNQKAGLPITAKGATFKGEIGAGERNRTPDRLITNQLLYLLSYASYAYTADHIP